MSNESFFPTGIVTGSSFCNRESERELLAESLKQNAHVVLISPRRYGKSSLITQFTLEQDIPFIAIDLLPATSSKYVRNAIVDGTSSLLDLIMPKIKKKREKLLQIFSVMNPVVELSAFGQKVKLTPLEKSPEETIMKLLLNLDKAAGELNKKIIFVMDEFQQIADLETSHSLEASIRHAVERSKNVFYIFSGSNRTLLEKMFKDKDRPLYHLCDEMRLSRITKNKYSQFIERASHEKWGAVIDNLSVDLILQLTECHPYYVNRLCRMLWAAKQPPETEAVRSTWNNYVEGQVADWVSESIRDLTVNQRGILATIAKDPVKELSGQSFTTKVELSVSSVSRTVNTLTRKDFIYRDLDGYFRVLNPVIRTYLESDHFSD